MESTAQQFHNAMLKMIEEGRPAWQELQELVEENDTNVSEVIAWLEDIDRSNEI